jgi:hypothetical protein
MAKLVGGRSGFRDWVDSKPDPDWPLMPLTHITKGIGAQDVSQAGKIAPTECDVFQEPLTYFFYGRPAYRVSGDGAIKVEAACPFCFIFNAELIEKSKAIFAFDTGAFDKRMYKHILLDEMDLEDFSLETDVGRPNRIISSVFKSKTAYFEGDLSKVADPGSLTTVWEFHARAYLDLILSRGRNEPDDRICSIEVIFGDPVSLEGNLLAVIVPHTLWVDNQGAPWLEVLQADGVTIVPYLFIPNRHPEYYHAIMEAAVRDLYKVWGVL